MSEPGQPAPPALLEIRGLRVEAVMKRQWREIVKGTSLHLRPGEILGLIGESGAGKSTLGLAAMGYARPGCRFSGGEVLFKGRDLLKLPSAALRDIRGCKISYVAQSAAAFFNPAHRLIDQFCEAVLTHRLGSRGAARDRAVMLYGMLGLPDPAAFGERYPHQVSGGQLQRAMIGMAMACEPDLIVFDEPTTALDVTTQAEVLAAIKRTVAQQHAAALYISHDLPVVAQLADRVMILKNGEVVEAGETQQVLLAPVADYTRRLIAAGTAHAAERDRGQPLLEVRNVTAGYRSFQVLKQVGLTVTAGRTVAIVGESGSGKSTLARVIAGLLPPAAGDVYFKGVALPRHFSQRRKELLRRIQLVHQSPDTALNPRQKIGDILSRPLQFYDNLAADACRQRVLELLQQVELSPDIAERYPRALSGGQKQRVCIARALASEPELIICDEITSGLDPLVAEGVQRLLAALQARSGTAYLYITHDLKLVEAIADEVVVMQQGAVVAAGIRSAVLSPPMHPYTQALLAAVPRLNPDWIASRPQAATV